MDGMSLVFDTKVKGGTTANASACEAKCKSTKGCTYGTWHDQHQGSYALMCILMTDNQYHPHRQDGHTSFVCNMTGDVPRLPDPLPGSIHWAEEPRRLDQQLLRSTGWRRGVMPLTTPPGTTTDGVTVYVDATKGSDSNAGARPRV
jgi:hypothetical protein